MYLMAVFIGLVTMGLLRGNRSTAMKVTRWAKANPKKTRRLIAAIQLALMGLGLSTGHNLKELGYELSDTMTYVFGAVMLLSFLSLPFKAKQNTVAMPKQVNRNRLGFLAVALASLMVMVGVGNKIGGNESSNTPLGYVINKAAQSPIVSGSSNEIWEDEEVVPEVFSRGGRKILAGVHGILGIVAIFFSVLLACAGICISIGGIAVFGAGISILPITPGYALAAILGGSLIILIGILLTKVAIQNIRKRQASRSQ